MTSPETSEPGPATDRQPVRTAAAILGVELRGVVPNEVKVATYLARKLDQAGVIKEE